MHRYNNNLLEEVRLKEGDEGLRKYINTLIKKDRRRLLDIINDDDLSFATFYIVKESFDNTELFNGLSEKNQIALTLIKEVNGTSTGAKAFDDLTLNYIQRVYAALKWIFESGSANDGLSDEYDKLLDMASIFLIKLYRDKDILPQLGDMIFKRHEQGRYNHDLVWAFFEGRDISSLIYIANRLKGHSLKEYELARKLLKFVPILDSNIITRDLQQYEAVLNWLEENSPYLVFTGESLNQSSRPIMCELSLGAKYIFKKVNNCSGNIIEELDEEEGILLEQFNGLDMNNKKMLSDYSCKLHKYNLQKWKEWISHPIDAQIRMCISGAKHD